MRQVLDQIIIVLNRPQKLVNIGGVVRAMKNMGLRRLRLVAPEEFDPYDIAGIAHRSDDILSTLTILPDLDTALADTTFVVGTTARRRTNSVSNTPRSIVPQIMARAADGPVALLFGSEDNGLSNKELDRCHQLVKIPTDDAYPSLNLAQAVLLLAYELHLAEAPAQPTARRHPPANAAQLEGVFGAAEQALRGVAFFKTEQTEQTMRTLRDLIHRATPDTQEAALLMAIAREISHFARRNP